MQLYVIYGKGNNHIMELNQKLCVFPDFNAKFVATLQSYLI